MKRPDIDSYKQHIIRCCNRHDFTKFCESWGCEQVDGLIKYIEYLEHLPHNKTVERIA